VVEAYYKKYHPGYLEAAALLAGNKKPPVKNIKIEPESD
jgi:hypothetical protein